MTARDALLDPLWRFGIQAWVSFRGLFMWFTPFPYVSNIFIAPFVNIALFSMVTRFSTGRDASDQVVVGMAVLALSGIVFGGILQSFTYERDFGTLPVILASRGSRLVAYWSRGALHYLDGLVAAAVTLLAAVVVFGVDVSATHFGTVTLALLAMSASCTAFALFGGNFTLILRNWLVLISVANGSMLALTGIVVPRDALHPLLEVIGGGLPLTHGLVALRAGVEGASPSLVAGAIGSELLVALGYAVVGSVLYRWIEYRARVRGEFHE